MKYWPLLLAVCALALGVAFITRAQIPDNVRWADPCVSHQGETDLNSYAGAALREWGQTSSITDCGAGADITISYVPGEPSLNVTLGAARVAWFGDGRIAWCTIEINAAATSGITQEVLYMIVAHEVGHCLGLNHVPGVALMNAFCCNWWSEIDRANIAAKYPTLPVPTITVIVDPTAIPTVAFPTATPERVPGGAVYERWDFPTQPIPADFWPAAVYEWRDGQWYRWLSGVPEWANTLTTLERGAAYWFVAWE